MVDKIGHIKNPLTVIAIFAAIAEISGTTVLPFIAPENQCIYIWFLMIFPTLLVILFFVTLNFNHRVLYAPSDYKDERNFMGHSTEAEKNEKLQQETIDEFSNESLSNEIEAMDGSEELPAGVEPTEDEKPGLPIDIRIKNSLMFENLVINKLNSGIIPFKYQSFKSDVRIILGGKKYILDCIIETPEIHYLIEIKRIEKLSTLFSAVSQINAYKSAYEEYLNINNKHVKVQPLIIVPAGINAPTAYRGIPIATFDQSKNTIQNLNATYSEYDLNQDTENAANLVSLLTNFLSQYSRWGFTPLRIQKWGSKQKGYESLELFSIDEIRFTLENMLLQGIVTVFTSKKGTRLYKIQS